MDNCTDGTSEDESSDEEEDSSSSCVSSTSSEHRSLTPTFLESLTLQGILQAPKWTCDLLPLHFDSLASLSALIGRLKKMLEEEIIARDYNTFTPFVDFYHKYNTSDSRRLVDFVTQFNDLTEKDDGLSCVGMSTRLLDKMVKREKKLRGSLAIVSCEEAVEDIDSYEIDAPDSLKEHVLLLAKITLGQEARVGYILMDPGYHVTRPVVIMQDGEHPHTGPFIVSASDRKIEQYEYVVQDEQFLSWTVKESRGGLKSAQWTNLIYTKKAFDKVAVTKKRSLLYHMKSYVVRSNKGPLAGIFAFLRSNCVNFFYPGEKGTQVRVKLPLQGKLMSLHHPQPSSLILPSLLSLQLTRINFACTFARSLSTAKILTRIS